MKYYFYNYTSPSSGNGYTVIFDHWPELYPQELSKELKEFHTYHEQRRKTIYIYPALPNRNIKEQISVLADIVNKISDDIILVPFNEMGIYASTSHEFSIAELIELGILNIVVNRNAVLESDESFHYVLPSEKHSPFFIRAGNMLSNSEEVNFLAMIILRWISDRRVNQISCDTSSILTLPYAVNYLLSLFGKTKHIPYDSFGSYGSMDDYEFLPRTLVLISASNSGRLEEKIRKRQVDVDFLTIIFNGERPTSAVLINLARHLSNILSITEKEQFPLPQKCKYCEHNSIPVVVRGDQFIPSRIIIQRVLLAKSHVPTWVKTTVDHLIFLESVSAFKAESLENKKRELFIDIEKALKLSDRLKAEFQKFLRNNIPASTNIIVHLQDRSSKYVGEQILKHLKGHGAKVRLISQNEIKNEIDVNEHNLILVVASCVTTGNKLNSISRDLRNYDKSSIHYFAVINRLSDGNKYEVLKKNLEYRNHRDQEINKFSILLDCYLGDYHCSLFNEGDKPSWESESLFWTTLAQKHNDTYITQRIEELEGKQGLLNNLFLPRIEGDRMESLVLRKNFAFHQIKESDLSKLTQADLYIIIAAVFHYLRNPKNINVDTKSKGAQKFLVQHEHVKTIIDPVCFKRYNDGIIQAAILRIATNSELNYSVSDRDSLDMLETLKDIFKDQSNADLSEALLEFLYAIASKKMRLKTYHMDTFLNFIEERYSPFEIVKILLTACRETNLT